VLLLAVALCASCDFSIDPETFAPKCRTPAPLMEGTWSGTLQSETLTITLDDECRQYLFTGPYWASIGTWSWNGHQGVASADPSVRRVGLTLGAFPQHWSNVEISLTSSIPLESTMAGYAKGAWRQPADSTQIIASFDSVPLVLHRR
jgi:hypothetical protein